MTEGEEKFVRLLVTLAQKPAGRRLRMNRVLKLHSHPSELSGKTTMEDIKSFCTAGTYGACNQRTGRGSFREHPLDSAYRPDIDGLRAIAILGVLGFHASSDTVPGGFCGVDVFFVISGFLITGILLRELDTKAFSIPRFYMRRARRLFPALIVVLLVTLGVGWLILLPGEFKDVGTDAGAGAAFFSNLRLYSNATPYFFVKNRPLLHLWSLGVEEQFYLLWPIFIYWAWRFGRQSMGIVATVIVMVSLISNVSIVSLNPPAAFFLPWNRLWELTLGSILAIYGLPTSIQPPEHNSAITLKIGWLRRRQADLCGFAGMGLLGASYFAAKDNIEFPGLWALPPTIGAALIIFGGSEGFINRRLLSHRPMVFVGKISYPLYLWHWPILCYARLMAPTLNSPWLSIALIALAFVLAYISYAYVELPVRHLASGPSVPVTLAGTLAVCGAVGYLIGSQFIRARPIHQDVERLVVRPSQWMGMPIGPKAIYPNHFIEVGGLPTRTLFIGDSFMEQYYPRIEYVIKRFPDRANSAVFAVRGACSLPYEFSWDAGREACRRHITKALQYAKRDDVKTIVIASAWSAYFIEWRHGHATLNPDANRALDRLVHTIDTFKKSNKRVFLVLTGPVDSALDPLASIVRTVFPPGFRVVNREEPQRKIISEIYAPIQSVLTSRVRSTGAIVIDPMMYLCNEKACPYRSSSGTPIYADAGHLHPDFVRENARYLDETLFESSIPRNP